MGLYKKWKKKNIMIIKVVMVVVKKKKKKTRPFKYSVYSNYMNILWIG